jgi:hypothetical protein
MSATIGKARTVSHMTTQTLTRTWQPHELVALYSDTNMTPAKALDITRKYASLDAAYNADVTHPVLAPGPAAQAVGEGFAYTLDDPAYPAHLKATPNPPAVLFGLGNRDLLNTAGVAMTGTRKPGPYGLLIAEIVASGAAHCHVPVITGGADGCDTVTMRAAFQYETPVILVPATGPDRHRHTTDVLAAGGLVVSEQPFGSDNAPAAPDYGRKLLARNRIIVGLGAVLVPTGGAFRSGTSAATWDAFAAGRPVLVAQPKAGARSQPDTQLASALADELGPTAGQLRETGCPKAVADKIAGRGRLANAVATSPDDLTQQMSILVQLSPWTAAPTDRRTA